MAKINFAFDGDESELDSKGSYTPLPKGEYEMMVVESSYKQTSTGTGMYVAVQFQVTDGEYEGRKFFANFNVENPSAKAQEIGRAQFGNLCRAIFGRPDCDDTDDLLDKIVTVGVDIDKKDQTRNRFSHAVASENFAKPVHVSSTGVSTVNATPWKK